MDFLKTLFDAAGQEISRIAEQQGRANASKPSLLPADNRVPQPSQQSLSYAGTDAIANRPVPTSGEQGSVRSGQLPQGNAFNERFTQGFGFGLPVTPEQAPPTQPERTGFPGPVRQSSQRPNRAATAVNPNGMYDPRVAKQIIDQYVAQGYDPRFAVGMAANAMIESSGNPTAYNQSEGAFGLFQHRLDRLDNLRSFADRLGKDVNDIGTQVSFSMHEFMAGEKMAYERIMSGASGESAAEYAALIDKYWERSDGSARDKRASLATQIYGDFFGEDGAYNNREILNFGTDIDPYGTQDNEALLANFDPSMTSMGALVPTGAEKFAMVMEASERIDPEQRDAPAAQVAADRAPDAVTVVPDRVEGTELPADLTNVGVLDGQQATGFALGTPVAPTSPAAAPASIPQGGAGGEDETSPRFLQGFVDKLYGTPNITDEERTVRRRAMAQAFAEGIGYLQGREVDMGGVYNRAAQSYKDIADRRTEEGQAQALATMATNMGMGQLAGLAHMGAPARNSLTQAMVSSISSKGTADKYELDAETRETLAAPLEETMPGVAATLRNPNVTGKALEDAAQQAFKFEVPDSGDKKAATQQDTLERYQRMAERIEDPERRQTALDFAPTAAENPDLADNFLDFVNQGPQQLNRDYELFRGMYGPEALDQLLSGEGEGIEQLQQQFEQVAFRRAQAEGGVNAPATPYQERALKRIATEDEQLTSLAQKSARIDRNMAIIRQQAMNPEFDSGILQGKLLLPIQNLAESLGFDVSLLNEEGGPLRVVQALSREMATLAREEGAGTTSNYDAQNYILTGPRETDTRKQILLLSQMHKYASRQNEEVASLRDQYLRENADSPDYYDMNKLNLFVEENMTRKQIFPELTVTADDTPETITKRVNAMAEAGQIEAGDVFITINPDGTYTYNAYGIPGWN